jgi:hypothetical protein
VLVKTQDNEKDMDNVAVTVNWAANAPTADAGQDQTVKEGETVMLDGTGSSAFEDLVIKSYQWEQTGGPDVEMEFDDTPSPEFTAPPVDGDPVLLTFLLTVTDQNDKTDTDEVQIHVEEGNSQPVARAGADRTVTETQTFTLDGSNSTDSDGEIEAWQWRQTSGPLVSVDDADTVRATCVAPSLDDGNVEATFELVVIDTQGMESQPDEVTITIKDAGYPPTAHAGGNQATYPGGSVTLSAEHSKDFDGQVTGYQWQMMEGPPGVSLSAADTCNPTITAPKIDQEAEIILKVIVTDDDGLQDSDMVRIAINNTRPPEADAGEDKEVAEGEIVTLDASGSSDPDGSIESYEWKQVDGISVSLSDPSSPNPEFEAPEIDGDSTELTFELAVADESGNTSEDQVKVKVNNHSSGGGGGGGCFISASK